MADIFISYAKADQARAAAVANALEARSWSVWWDRKIPPGKTFSQVIAEAIDAAKCVLALWSKDSIKSQWVQEEAGIAKQRNILIPALIGPVEPPLGFRLIQAADLIDCKPASTHEGFTTLLDAIAAITGAPPQKDEPERQPQDLKPETASDIRPEKKEVAKPPPATTKARSRGPIIAISVLVVIMAAAGLWFLRPADTDKKEISNFLGMKFVYIPHGIYTMGSPENESGRNSNGTRHQVTLTKGFYMQTTEVTQGQWQEIMGSNLSKFKGCGDDCPVENVFWEDVQMFIDKLNKKQSDRQYRLPTEAQWEYAARAGSRTAFANGNITEIKCGHDPKLDAMGWYCGNSGSKTHPVAQKEPNRWGLYDMHGNVWEWMEDWYSAYPSSAVTDPKGSGTGSHRVIRGGGWGSPVGFCRSAYRGWYGPGNGNSDLGFRLVLLPGQQARQKAESKASSAWRATATAGP